MEQSRYLLRKINVPTVNLKMDPIHELLILVKDTKSNLSNEFWEEAAQKLWKHLKEGLGKLDDQLLCATCFYSVIMLTDKEDYYLDNLLHIVGPEPSSPSQVIRQNMPGSKRVHVNDDEYHWNEFMIETTEEQQATNTLRIVSLMYGMFQSSFLIRKGHYSTSKIAAVLKEMFDLLLLMAYEYSPYTFLAFKTIKSFKKVCGGIFEKHIFNKENQVKLLALVNNNWENPVTGVRDLNRSIFQTVISTLDSVTYERVLKDIDGFYWNKGKFLMLSEIIENFNGDIMSLVHGKWVQGLMHSLYKPGLVSAGADMYYSLLKKLKNHDDWCQLFLCHILNILNGTSTKAIENFTNYWCLTTIKKFGTIVHVLIDELVKLEDSEKLLYSKLCIMKQANRLGIVNKHSNVTDDDRVIQEAVVTGIEHCNVHIRMLAFDIVCVSQGRSIPSELEYNLILNYLHMNVNSDSTVLRLNMFSSFNMFLIQLHSTFFNVMIREDKTEVLEDLLAFYRKLQDLIIINLNVNGNYQRKITTVKLCGSILNNCSEISKKKKDQIRQANITLIGFLKQKDNWLLSTNHFIMKLISLLKDPADDIRENVVKILLNHYVNELQDVDKLTHIINNAKQSIQSKFFYEISCGQSMFKLITNLLIKEKKPVEAEYRCVQDIFDYAYNELITQHAAKTNVLESIETGKQLHSFMSILLVVLQECVTNSYKLNIHSRISELLEVLQTISNQFAWEEEGSSDFSKMNEMVQNIIESSDYNPVDVDDQTKISGLQQIVLNCLWLSVKASCDLASILVQYNENNVPICEKCLNIITGVLETCRHKGAIEAAGAALGRSIQYVTSLHPENDRSRQDITEEEISCLLRERALSKLPFNLLEIKLHNLVSETNKKSSVTRRGAGLSIMVHRIASSDMKKGKPLFHYFIKNLLRIIDQAKVPRERMLYYTQDTEVDNVGEQKDLPKAIYIHFMTRIVTDSSLATDTMYYSVELAELAFSNLTSPHWQIRNAALQLYGALIPRLIGQKKASGTDEETVATVSCDEMRTHLPKLWQYIKMQLKEYHGKDTIQTHSNLVPILSMLANSAKRYIFSLHFLEQEIEFYDLFYHLVLLLSSSIYTVRRLTAETIFNLYKFEFITNGIIKQENITENLLHGFLLLVNICHSYYSSDPVGKDGFRKLNARFGEILSRGTHSYLSKKLYEDIYVNDIDIKDIQNTILEMNGNKSPGVQIWAEARFKKYINKCAWNDVPSLLTMLLQQCDHETYCELVFKKIHVENNIPTAVVLELVDILTSFERKYCSSIIWKILYQMSLKTNLHAYIDAEALLKNVEDKTAYNLRYIVPLVARNIQNTCKEIQSRLLQIINDLNDFENADVDMRYIAVVANNELAHVYNELPDSLKVISIKCAVLFLQDEDEDVRNTGVKFVSILKKDKGLLQPYICLNKILDKSFLQTVFDAPQSSIEELSTKLSVVLHSNHNIDEYNPFANDSKNIYFEPDILKQIVDHLTE